MIIETTPEQALHGTRLTLATSVRCQDCATTLGTGDSITISATPGERDLEWAPTRVFCTACSSKTEIEPDQDELTITGRLMTTSDPTTQEHALTFTTTGHTAPIGPFADNRSESDTKPNSDPTPDPDPEPEPDPDHALIGRSTDQADRVYHYDDGTGSPLCNSCGAFESFPIEEAKARTTRLCQACECTHRGGYDTRPCPHCGASVARTRWPIHVRNCSGASSTSDSKLNSNSETPKRSASHAETDLETDPPASSSGDSRTEPNDNAETKSELETEIETDSNTNPDRTPATPPRRGQDPHPHSEDSLGEWSS